MSARYTPLRGRIIIRPTGDSGGYEDQFRRAGLVMPDTAKFDPRLQKNQNSLGRGIVVAMGPPALHPHTGREVVPGFQVGDEVLHIGQHKSRDVEWDGVACRACSQEEVCAVLEADDPEMPYVCPGCYAVGPERCLPGCIDAEIAAESELDMQDRALTDDGDTEPPPEYGTEGMSE